MPPDFVCICDLIQASQGLREYGGKVSAGLRDLRYSAGAWKVSAPGPRRTVLVRSNMRWMVVAIDEVATIVVGRVSRDPKRFDVTWA